MVASNDLNISQSGLVTFDGVSTFTGRTLTAGAGISIINGNGVAGNPVISANITTDLHAARYIVSAGGSADGANYTTLNATYAAAVAAGAPQTVFLQPGVYTTDQTMVAGINIAAFNCDAITPNVTILGKVTADYSGKASISGINLKTNSDFCLVVSGSNVTNLTLTNCFIDANNNTAMSITNSNSASKLYLYYCSGEIDTTGITYFTHSGICAFKMFFCNFENDGSSSTASTISATVMGIFNSAINFSITTSSTGGLGISYTNLAGALILNGSGVTQFNDSNFLDSGTTPITIGASATLTATDISINTAATNAIAGSGILNCNPISFTGSSSTIQNTLTVNQIPFLPVLITSNGGTGLGSPSTSGNLLTSNGTIWTSAAPAASSLTTTFLANGTWNKNSKTKSVEVYGWAGGGGGGSGRKGTSAAAGSGAGGGAGGSFYFKSPASFFGNSESVVIGTGGAGGNAQTSDANNGNPGSNGNPTSFGNMLALGGALGLGGTTGSVSGGTAGFAIFSMGRANATSGASGAASTASAPTITGPSASANPLTFSGTSGGGGGGGNIVTQRPGTTGGAIGDINASIILAGGAGGLESTGIDGHDGNVFTSGGLITGGTGGGGGGGYSVGASGATSGGKGGKGALGGGGGGGGGGGIDTIANSGAGGNGGDGQVIVIEYF